MPLSASSSARDTLITLYAPGADVDDGFTTVPGAPTGIGQVWASISYGTGQERRQAAQEVASVSATFRVLRTPLTEQMVVRGQIGLGGMWDVTSIVPAEGRTALDITAVRAA